MVTELRAILRRRSEVLLYVLASILIGRATVQQNEYNAYTRLFMREYESGHFAMPFQGRYMMVPVLRWAGNSPWMERLATLMRYSSASPEQLCMQFVNVICVIVLGFLISRLTRSLVHSKAALPWLPRWLLLWVLSCTYVARYESRFIMPYDLPAVLFFTVGLVAVAEDRFLPLLVAVVVGAFNRETMVFLMPIWLASQFKRRPALALVQSLVLVSAWFGVRHQIQVWIGQTNWGVYNALAIDRSLLLPHHLPQVLSVGGFLPLPLILNSHLLKSRKLALMWMGAIPFFASTLVLGWWNETRIFGEVSALFAVTAGLEMEAFIQDRLKTLGTAEHASQAISV